MGLIHKQKIEEAAKDLSMCRFDLKGQLKYGDIYEQGIIAGANFALKEVEPLVVEFSEFCSSIERNSLTGLYWFNLKHLTTNKLLEEFIKSKNEQL